MAGLEAALANRDQIVNGVVSEKWIRMNPQGIAAGVRPAMMLLST